MAHWRRCLRWSLAVLACAVVTGGTTVAGASLHAHVARSCNHTPPYPGSGYFTSLKVTGTGCGTGGNLILAYYRCRTRSGPAGRCQGGVLGFHCREKRHSIPTQIDALVTCRRHKATVVHTYQADV